jgi:hypothetical protein
MPAALMRVNHVGEICAQALYQGQALTSRQELTFVRRSRRPRAKRPNIWRGPNAALAELGSRTSLLNPVWYLGALVIGVAAGKLGDDWSLGFLAETERQVEAHLDGHLSELPDAGRAVAGDRRADAARRDRARRNGSAARRARTPGGGSEGDATGGADDDANRLLRLGFDDLEIVGDGSRLAKHDRRRAVLLLRQLDRPRNGVRLELLAADAKVEMDAGEHPWLGSRPAPPARLTSQP